MTFHASLPRRAAAELIGTAGLLVVVIGSGIQAAALSRDTGVALVANSLASAIGLGLIITLFGPLSGAHLNPVVTLTSWWGRRSGGDGLGGREALVYTAAQTAGAIGGAVLAEAMFGRTPGTFATQVRDGGHLLVGEVVATAGLVLVIQGLGRIGRPRLIPAAVAAYIAAAIWFTSSGSFANPAGTIGRAFSDSFTGIAPQSLPGFVAAQLVGGALGLVLAGLLYGKTGKPGKPGNTGNTGKGAAAAHHAATVAEAEIGTDAVAEIPRTKEAYEPIG
ncbi:MULTISPECIES: aquaporin [unclassified Streptomyces]|uniref:aquaporin n=1 Tax=unclassified Streptomyces TaxID=2593676 RepID=UPI001BEA1385|nr:MULTISPECIES: aquaporin [unclassified Streptomyces]MBT2402796.1 aquaporin [Streptomyces sp. ISL-21]MBT2607246.1 aquaporin [Streptomyces sp. ISL-87]